MATPEALFLARLHGQDPQEPNLLQRETREAALRLRERNPERFQRIDSLQFVLDSLSRPSPRDIETAYLERLGQLHEQDPDQFPSPDEIKFELREDRDGNFRRIPVVDGMDVKGQTRALEFWRAVQMDLEERAERRASEIGGEILRESIMGMPSAIGETVGTLDRLIREIDPTAPVRETVRREASEGADALGSLLQLVGEKFGQGVDRAGEFAGEAGEVLGQGATDLEFLLREFVLNEIIGDGGGNFPSGNPRAVEAERFAEGPRDRLMARLLGPR